MIFIVLRAVAFSEVQTSSLNHEMQHNGAKAPLLISNVRFTFCPPRFRCPAQYLGAFGLRYAFPASFPAVSLHVVGDFVGGAALRAGGFHRAAMR